MTEITHKPGIHENYLVTRCLELAGLYPADTDALVSELNALATVDEVVIKTKGKRAELKITYDASVRQAPLAEIAQALAQHEVQIANGWWNRLKHRNYQVTDQNIYDNARYEPSCCSKAPPGK